MSTTDLPAAEPLVFVISSEEARPALTLGSGWPKTRNGLPCHYYWRDAICDGVHTHPQKGFVLSVTPDQRKQWQENFHRMKAAGEEPPIVRDHKEGSADATLGYVVDVAQNGKWLSELHQYLGDDSMNVALRNKVSVGIDPQYKNSKGEFYGSTIIHSAITSRPVIPGQGDAVPVLLAGRSEPTEAIYLSLNELTPPAPAAPAVVVTPAAQPPIKETRIMPMSLACSDDTIAALHKLVPGLADAPPEEKLTRIHQHMLSRAAEDEADAGGPEAVATMSRADIYAKARTNRTMAKTAVQQLAQANERLVEKDNSIKELSLKVVKPLDAESESALITAAEIEAGQLVREGSLSPNNRDLLMSVLVKDKGKTNTIALSRAANLTGDKPLVFAVLSALRGNKPPAVGEQTGVQEYSRADSAATEAAKNAKAVSDQMLAYANNKA